MNCAPCVGFCFDLGFSGAGGSVFWGALFGQPYPVTGISGDRGSIFWDASVRQELKS